MKKETAITWINKLDGTSDVLTGWQLKTVLFLRETLIRYKEQKLLPKVPEDWGERGCGSVLRTLKAKEDKRETEEAFLNALYRLGTVFFSRVSCSEKKDLRPDAEYLAECIRTFRRGWHLAEDELEGREEAPGQTEGPDWFQKEQLLQQQFETILQLYSLNGRHANISEKLGYLANRKTEAVSREEAKRLAEKTEYLKAKLEETDKLWNQKNFSENERIFTKIDVCNKCKDHYMKEGKQDEIIRYELEQGQKKGETQEANGGECRIPVPDEETVIG